MPALAFGISLNALHSRLDRAIDSILFRRRHLAELRLDRAARTLWHADSSEFIDDVLVVEASEALMLASAAIFRKENDGSFTRTLSRGWDSKNVGSLGHDDRLVVALLAELEPIDMHDVRWSNQRAPAGAAQPLYALPFVVRHEMLGFALYSGHTGGEALDPDERRTLQRLADSAASAYEHVRTKVVVAEANDLRMQNALLTKEQHVLREMVDALKAATS